MCTCRCRKIRLSPYEGMDLQTKVRAATRAGDWVTVDECFALLEQTYKERTEAAERAEEDARKEAQEQRFRAGVMEANKCKAENERDAAIEARNAALLMSDDEKVAERVREAVKALRPPVAYPSTGTTTVPLWSAPISTNDYYVDTGGTVRPLTR